MTTEMLDIRQALLRSCLDQQVPFLSDVASAPILADTEDVGAAAAALVGAAAETGELADQPCQLLLTSALLASYCWRVECRAPWSGSPLQRDAAGGLWDSVATSPAIRRLRWSVVVSIRDSVWTVLIDIPLRS